MPIVNTTAVLGDLLFVIRGRFRPRITVESIAALGRSSNSTPLVIETRTTDPDTPVEGQLWLRTDL